MLGTYLQQTASAESFFRCIFLGALRVKTFLFETSKARALVFGTGTLPILFKLWPGTGVSCFTYTNIGKA